MRVGVLASGSGTILETMLERGDIPIVAVVADRRCRALEVGASAGIAVVLVERTEFGSGFDRTEYTDRVIESLQKHRVELVAMAGFGTILAPQIFELYGGRILNTHPALLPAFKGWHAVEDALAAGVKVTGCTVHVATEDVDDGPILAQEAVPVLGDDTVETLHERIKTVERRIYPRVVAELASRAGTEKEAS